MVPLILFVFFFLLFCKVISIVGKDTISEHLWSAFMYVSRSPTIRSLRQAQHRANEIYRERSNTSAKDEFARWAKLDREYGKIRTEIESLQNSLSSSKTSFKSVVKVALFALTTGFKFVIRFKYRKLPMFFLPPNILPYLGYWVLSFSSAPIGSVSVSWWLFIADGAISAVENVIKLGYEEYFKSPVQESKGSESPVGQDEKPKENINASPANVAVDINTPKNSKATGAEFHSQDSKMTKVGDPEKN